MKILICLATELEKLPVENRLEHLADINQGLWRLGHHDIYLTVTGVGSVATVFHMMSYPGIQSFDLLVQAGIAGSFHPELPVGSVAEVVSERFSDLGIEERDGSFRDVFVAGLVPPDDFPFQQGVLNNPVRYTDLPLVSGITVHTVHGEAGAIQNVKSLYHPDVESMEGAAFFYTALQLGIPFCQIRAISNHVEPRDKTKWNIPLALDRLAEELVRFLKSASKPEKTGNG